MKNKGLLKKIFLVMVIFSYLQTFSQNNLVPNPSFEDYTLPGTFGPNFDLVSEWTDTLNVGSPDYHHINGNGALNLSMIDPFCNNGNQCGSTFQGDAVVGLYFDGGTKSEWLQASLTSNMQAGQDYEISFYLRDPPSINAVSSNWGVLLSNTVYHNEVNPFSFFWDQANWLAWNAANPNPLTFSPDTDINWDPATSPDQWVSVPNLVNHSNWIQYSFIINANSNYSEIYIGMMGNPTSFQTDGIGGGLGAYVWIDSISITPIISVDAGLDVTICEGEQITLTADNPDNATISWNNGVVDGQAFSPTTTATYIVTASNGNAFVTDTVTVTVVPIINVDAGIDQNFCVGDQVTLTADNPNNAQISWSNNIIDGIPFTINNTETYVVTATIGNCIATDDILLTVFDIPFIDAGLDQTVCEGDIVTLTVNNPNNAQILWDNNIIDGVPFAATINQVYTVTATLNNCVNTDVVNVIVQPFPIINAGVDQIICEGTPITLTAFNPDNAIITWNNNVIDGDEFIPLVTQDYEVTANLNGCESVDVVNIDLTPYPLLNAGPDLSICLGDSIKLTAENPHNGILSWSNEINDGEFFIPEETTIYTVESNLNGCISISTVSVIINPLPDASFYFSPTNPTVENTLVNFNLVNNQNNIINYHWNFGDSQISNLERPSHNFPEVGGESYTTSVVITDNNGCIDSSFQNINVSEPLIYYVPNAFTPDGDNLNNVFKPIFTSGYDPYGYHIIIFNRWGEIIFESYNSEIGWDGTKNGVKVQDGIYVWKIVFKENKTDKKHQKIGHVTLLR